MTGAKGFITLLRKAVHSRYGVLLLNNRMLMQCYDLDMDGDVGLHYILPIPDTAEYRNEFYDQTILIPLAPVITAYTEKHKEIDAIRKEQKYKPKELVEEVCLIDSSLKFIFQLADNEPIGVSIPVTIPTDIDPTVSNILKHYTKLVNWIKPGGVCIDIDGTYQGLQERVTSTPEIMFYNLRYAGKKVRVPLYKSLFVGVKELDLFRFNIQETMIDDVYINTVHIRKGDIEEIFWGYILNY